MIIDNKYKVLELDSLELYSIANLIDPLTCGKIIECIDNNCSRSTVTVGSKKMANAARTSSTCYLERSAQYKSQVKYLQSVILEYINLPYKSTEPLQGQRYLIGEYYSRHTDFFTPNTRTFREFTKVSGQRTWTAMIYLNDVISGGETFFPTLNFGIMPTQGTMIIWNNLMRNGKENYDTMHEALPPKSNPKYIVTQWFRQNSYR